MKLHCQKLTPVLLCTLCTLLCTLCTSPALAADLSESGDTDVSFSAPSGSVAVDVPTSGPDTEQPSVAPGVVDDGSYTPSEDGETDYSPDWPEDYPYYTDVVAEAPAPAVYNIVDNRDSDDSDSDSDDTEPVGMKGIVHSLFGPYVPTMTDTAVPETVGGSTTVRLYETVAPGAAGLDVQWLLSVLTFAILLYCLIKLIGVFTKY